MTNQNTNSIEFLSAHIPALADGEYTFTVNHNLTTTDHTTENGTTTPSPKSSPYTKEIKVVVNGPRFSFASSEIHSVFPPLGSSGDYRANLPTLALTRSTLPWERKPYNTYNGEAAWLFLLMVDENKKDSVTEGTYQYSDLSNTDVQKKLGIIDYEVDKKFIDQRKPINYIQIDNTKATGQRIMGLIPATLDKLKYWSYARIKSDENEEHAVLVGNCLPKPGFNSTVYLISLENKYDTTEKLNPNQTVFPYLYKWTFYSTNRKLYSFADGNMDKIAHDSKLTSVLSKLQSTFGSDETVYDNIPNGKNNFNVRLTTILGTPLSPDVLTAIKKNTKLPGATFHEVLSNLRGGTGFLNSPGAEPNTIYSTGSDILPLQKVENDLPFYSSALYRGPLVAALINLSAAQFTPDLKVKRKANSGKPIFIDSTSGYIPKDSSELIINLGAKQDLSYATAFELGKLTALADSGFAQSFFEWKHEVSTAIQLKKNISGDISHLAVSNQYDENKPYPHYVRNKINDWILMKGIPTRYFVPVPEYFPKESIRYFYIDKNWINAFICGAFSIGHTVEVDLSAQLTQLFMTSDNYTGFLFNSLAIDAWPDYELEVFDNDTPPAFPRTGMKLPLRRDKLNKSTEIYIYDSLIQQLYFHLHPGKQHPGFLSEDGKFLKTNLPNIVDISIPNQNFTSCIAGRRISVSGLISKFKAISNLDITVPLFHAYLMEGTPEVVMTCRAIPATGV